MIEPLGKRTAVYLGVHGWTAVYFIGDNLPTEAAARTAVAAFTTPYAAGWRDAMIALWTLWVEQGAREAEAWLVSKFSGWLRNAVGRLAPGVGS